MREERFKKIAPIAIHSIGILFAVLATITMFVKHPVAACLCGGAFVSILAIAFLLRCIPRGKERAKPLRHGIGSIFIAVAGIAVFIGSTVDAIEDSFEDLFQQIFPMFGAQVNGPICLLVFAGILSALILMAIVRVRYLRDDAWDIDTVQEVLGATQHDDNPTPKPQDVAANDDISNFVDRSTANYRFARASDMESIAILDDTALGASEVIPAATFAAWLQVNQRTFKVFAPFEEFHGYFSILPLRRETMERFVRGEVSEDAFMPEDILSLPDCVGIPYIYIFSVVLDKESQGNSGKFSCLVREIFKTILQIVQDRDVDNLEIYASGATPHGIKTLELAGFQKIQEGRRRKDGHPLYSTTWRELVKLSEEEPRADGEEAATGFRQGPLTRIFGSHVRFEEWLDHSLAAGKDP